MFSFDSLRFWLMPRLLEGKSSVVIQHNEAGPCIHNNAIMFVFDATMASSFTRIPQALYNVSSWQRHYI